MKSSIVVTGGSGFIGSNFIHSWIESKGTPVINLDALTYAGNPENLAALGRDRRYTFVKGSIDDRELVSRTLHDHAPAAIIHFAAESHVDRSILGPAAFIQTNICGTFSLLEAAKEYWEALDPIARKGFRFLHVSTDEVYGSLSPQDLKFSETTPYAPNSPYSASKAASDHLVRAYHHTYGLPTLTTNCSNNYGPYQFPEKLIPLIILNALQGKGLPIYGDGKNVRDWLFVEDHCAALRAVMERGRIGETYNIGGSSEMENIAVVRTVCAVLDSLEPGSQFRPHHDLIRFVQDRPGHDRRYAVNTSKIESELGWRPAESFESGIRKTVAWYLANRQWCENVNSGAYQRWLTTQYKAAAEQ